MNNSMEVPQKLKNKTNLRPSNCTTRYLSKGYRYAVSKGPQCLCTPVFIATLLTIAKVWKEPKCPSMDEWIKKCETFGNASWCSQVWKTVWRFLKKLKIELPYDPAIAILGIYTRHTGVLFWRDICTPVLIEALSTIAKVWKEPKCPSMDEWIKKMWYIYIQWSITRQSKRMKSCHLQLRGWNWRVLC